MATKGRIHVAHVRREHRICRPMDVVLRLSCLHWLTSQLDDFLTLIPIHSHHLLREGGRRLFIECWLFHIT